MPPTASTGVVGNAFTHYDLPWLVGGTGRLLTGTLAPGLSLEYRCERDGTCTSRHGSLVHRDLRRPRDVAISMAVCNARLDYTGRQHRDVRAHVGYDPIGIAELALTTPRYTRRRR